MEEHTITCPGIRFSERRDDKEVGHAYVIFITNDLHEHPYAFIEDVWVEEAYAEQGIGRSFLRAIEAAAMRARCYKIIATSRDDGTRTHVHSWYIRAGLKAYGTEFRKDLT